MRFFKKNYYQDNQMFIYISKTNEVFSLQSLIAQNTGKTLEYVVT